MSMNLECLNNIITNNLGINIDLSNINSWDLNTGFTTISLNKWSNAKSDNINLIDFGLTGFDNGRTNIMWEGITLTPNDTLFSMYRIGYNDVLNPNTFNYSGISATTIFDSYSISAITTGSSGNYFMLDGGYLQGFYKLDDYNYELFPSRYNNGITIETLLYLLPESQGIFYMMGTRAEDKYNPYFSGELITGSTITGITTSNDNYLDSFLESLTRKKAFSVPEDSFETKFTEIPQIDNLKNNVIAFKLTQDKKIAYEYIDNDGLIISNKSNAIINATGFTLISITFTPNYVFENSTDLLCGKQRLGELSFYCNGRLFWKVKEFPEFYFKKINNDADKQIGVPYSISWGGGSFGLKHSWHYDYQTYEIYTGQDTDYINNNFIIETTGGTQLSGLTMFEDNQEMVIEHTGNTSNNYFIKFNNPISILSNRDYVAKLSLYNNNFFNSSIKKVSVLMYSDTTDINIIDDIEYTMGDSEWIDINSVFRTEDNSGQNYIYLGLLIECDSYNSGGTLHIKNFTYTGADILVQDDRKDNELIQQNFDSYFIGGIQKLRVYNNALNSQEILHNSIIESKINPNIIVNKGGRIIYR